MKLFTVQKRNNKVFLLILALLFNIVAPYFTGRMGSVHAAQLTEASIRLTRMSATVPASTTNPILVVAKPATTATEATVKLTIPDATANGFTVSTTASNHTVSTTGLPSTYQGETLTAWPDIDTASAASDGGNSTAVTFPSGDLTPGTLYGFYITGGITNPSSGNAGTKVITITTQATGPAAIDSNDVAVDITATNADQVTLYATVSATFNFALSANTISMDALSTSARAYGSVTADIDTNAGNGWVAWMRSEGGSATLASATTGDSISSTNTGSPVTASIGSKGYVIDVGVTNGTGAGTPNVSTEYDGGSDDAANTSSTAGGVLSTSYEEIATSDGPGDSDGITLMSVVTISGVTEAASDYTDTWEVVGAGNF
jgi:hypothetical protein